MRGYDPESHGVYEIDGMMTRGKVTMPRPVSPAPVGARRDQHKWEPEGTGGV
jgi:hypothetical protein